ESRLLGHPYRRHRTGDSAVARSDFLRRRGLGGDRRYPEANQECPKDRNLMEKLFHLVSPFPFTFPVPEELDLHSGTPHAACAFNEPVNTLKILSQQGTNDESQINQRRAAGRLASCIF